MEYNEVRIAKVEEWQRYPLDTPEHQQNWMQYKLATNEIRIPVEPPKHGETTSLSSDLRQSQERPQSGPARKRQKTMSKSQETMISGMSNDPSNESTISPRLSLTGAGAETSDGAEALLNLSQIDSKAKRLSNLHSRKYF
ncbi:hypothetical protein QM012_005456 [Aureobasidium pullulans]|uniref:Uncharacterized protein n=1 Tax=Aureobasidium pullulans TaxID=5580 RepID=A0ABR0T5Y3_AURPU